MAAEKKYNWIKIGEAVNDFFWQENDLCEITVKGKTICIAKHGDQVLACTHKCPHAGGRAGAQTRPFAHHGAGPH